MYSAGEFRTDCLRLINEIAARGRVPLLVGGTMLYYRALFGGIAELPAADRHCVRAIDARAARDGWPALHAELAARDPDGAARIHPNDAQRIQRALEVLDIVRTNAGRTLEQLNRDAAALFARLEHLHAASQLIVRALHEVLATTPARNAARRASSTEVQQPCWRAAAMYDSPVLRLVGYRQLVAHCRGAESLACRRGACACRHSSTGQAPAHMDAFRQTVAIWRHCPTRGPV